MMEIFAIQGAVQKSPHPFWGLRPPMSSYVIWMTYLVNEFCASNIYIVTWLWFPFLTIFPLFGTLSILIIRNNTSFYQSLFSEIYYGQSCQHLIDFFHCLFVKLDSNKLWAAFNIIISLLGGSAFMPYFCNPPPSNKKR